MTSNLVTINVITYNHEKFIAKCLESILSQKTDFGYVIRIFDDCSTDNTQKICKDYANRYPEKIELHFSDKNLGIIKNPLRAYENIKTKYYMYIEGDDYCCDNNKLQLQVDALEKNPDCVFCSHRAKIYYYNKNALHGCFPNLKKGKYTIEDLKNKKLYFQSHLASRVVRTDAISIDYENPENFLFDITQVYELFQKGSMYYIDRIMSIYVITDEGLWCRRPLTQKYKSIFDTIMKYNEYTGGIFEKNLFYNLQKQIEYAHFAKYELNEHLENGDITKIFTLKALKHYILPPMIIDILNTPRDIIRKLQKRY